MIYLLYGSDKDKARAKANKLVEGLRAKKPDASFFKMTAESWSEAQFDEYIHSQGLFEQKYIVLFDGMFDSKQTKEAAQKQITTASTLREMKDSPHVFIFRESELDKVTLGKFEKNSVKVQEFGAERASSASSNSNINIFSLADALGKHDRKLLWVLYQKAKKAGIEDEQIHGMFFWQVKNMLIVRDAANALEAKLSPFVFGKAKTFTANFREGELGQISSRLISLYHDSRRGIHELNSALEHFILTF
jgi:DNA polymerase III delta subunit